MQSITRDFIRVQAAKLVLKDRLPEDRAKAELYEAVLNGIANGRTTHDPTVAKAAIEYMRAALEKRAIEKAPANVPSKHRR